MVLGILVHPAETGGPWWECKTWLKKIVGWRRVGVRCQKSLTMSFDVRSCE
jgi:hypothetical protein